MNLTTLVMHGLAIKKHATPETVAGIVGLDVDKVKHTLEQLVHGGRAIHAQGRYALTPAARMVLDSSYSANCGELRTDADFNAGYEEFERLNGTLKTLITDWQTMTIGGERVPNDHSDKDHDNKIVNRLGELAERAEAAIAKLTIALPRMHLYQGKLLFALEKAEDGAIEWVSDAKIESYHTVWFELHEDLLRLMGRERQE